MSSITKKYFKLNRGSEFNLIIIKNTFTENVLWMLSFIKKHKSVYDTPKMMMILVVKPKAFVGPQVPPGMYVGLRVAAVSEVAWPARQASVPQFGSSHEIKEFRDTALTSWGEFDGICKMLQS